MTALKCILWRRPRKHFVWRQPTMSLTQSNFQKYKVRAKQLCLKHWFNSRRFYRARLLSRPIVDNREMPCLEPLIGSSGDTVPTSQEMPTLVPFTTEYEDPVFKMQDGKHSVRVVGGEKDNIQPVVLLQRIAASSQDGDEEQTEYSPLIMDGYYREDGVISPLSVEGFPHQDDWLQWQYEGCSCEDIVDVAPGFGFPEIDIIDGMEFLSFLQEEDMNEYSRTHSRSLLSGDLFFQDSIPSGASSEDFGDDKSRSIIVPTKTKDITQIKGWKRKMFAEDAEDTTCFLRSPPRESPSWMQEESVATEDLVLEEKSSSSAKPAFVSNSLDEFLKNSSKLQINLLTSYIPNILAIPSNSSILSIGALTKEGSMPLNEGNNAEDHTSSIYQKCDLPFTELENKETEEEGSQTGISPRNPIQEFENEVDSVTKIDELQSDDEEVEIETNRADLDRSSPLSWKETNSPQTKCQRLIRETVLTSEEDCQKISDFFLSLRTLPISVSEPPKRHINFPTVSEQAACCAVKTLLYSAVIKSMKEQVPSVKRRGRKRKVFSEVTLPAPREELKTPKKRNKRLTRLPARLLDSALIIPGSEGWVSPDLSHSDISKKSHSPRVERDVISHDLVTVGHKVTKSKSVDYGKPLPLSLLSDTLSTSLKPQTQKSLVPIAGLKGRPSMRPLKLKFLGEEGRYGALSVQSLLIVHSSLSKCETRKDRMVNLPLAALALTFDSSKGIDDENTPLYLLYGSVDAVNRHQSKFVKAKSLDGLFKSASPIVPILRSISANVLLKPLPFVVPTVLNNKRLSLLVYTVQCELSARLPESPSETPCHIQKTSHVTQLGCVSLKSVCEAKESIPYSQVATSDGDLAPVSFAEASVSLAQKNMCVATAERDSKTACERKFSHGHKGAICNSECQLPKSRSTFGHLISQKNNVESSSLNCYNVKSVSETDVSQRKLKLPADAESNVSHKVSFLDGLRYDDQPFMECKKKTAKITTVNGFDGKLGDISSLRVLKNNIVVKPASSAIMDSIFSNKTLQSLPLEKNLNGEKESKESKKCLFSVKNGLHSTSLQWRDSVGALQETVKKKDVQKHFDFLYRLLSPYAGCIEKISVNKVVRKATRHILRLSADAKRLKEEKRRLRVTRTGLVTTYMQSLETLPPSSQKEAVALLSQQVSIPVKGWKEALSAISSDPSSRLRECFTSLEAIGQLQEVII